MKYFMYLQFGKISFQRELCVSIASLVNIMKDVSLYRIVIFTDQMSTLEKKLEKYRDVIIFHELEGTTINEWTENGRYCYSAKVRAIQLFFDIYHEDVIFLDTDTVICKEMLSLFGWLRDCFIMNFQCRKITDVLSIAEKYENNISDYKVSLRYEQRIKCFRMLRQGITYKVYECKVDENNLLFNSGVIGIAYEKHKILSQVTDMIQYLVNNSDYGAAEEVAFSLVFQQHGEVKTIDEYLIHYYECKETYLVAGYLLGMLSEEEEKELFNVIQSYGVHDIALYDVEISECNAFMDYVRLYKSNIQPYFGNRIESQCYTSDEKINAWEKLNKRCFRKWMKKERDR